MFRPPLASEGRLISDGNPGRVRTRAAARSGVEIRDYPYPVSLVHDEDGVKVWLGGSTVGDNEGLLNA
eukprot:6040620-Alexandrium_andersonii.AAC.1